MKYQDEVKSHAGMYSQCKKMKRSKTKSRKKKRRRGRKKKKKKNVKTAALL